MKAGGTIYSIKISDAESAGFRTIAQGSAEADSDNMLLAFNFILDRVCINTHSPELSPFHIRYKTPKDESKSAVVKKGNKVFVNIVEPPILVYDAVHATIRHRANIEEPKLIDIFQRLQAIGRSNINRHSSLVDNNMKESIGAYEKAMWSFDKKLAFQELFIALEKVTNIDGVERRGDTFDAAASGLSGILSTKIRRCRELYNRLKHPARNSKDVGLLYEHKDLPTDLIDLRKCMQTALLSKIR